MKSKGFLSDINLAAIRVRFNPVLVGYASAEVIVYQIAITMCASQEVIDS